jgi:hypothetical protein
MIHCWRAIKNATNWRLSYEACKSSIKNGGANVGVVLDGEVEAHGNNALPSQPRGHKVTKANLKRDGLTLALSETLKAMIAEKEDDIVKREDKGRREKEATCATFVNLTKQARQVEKLDA